MTSVAQFSEQGFLGSYSEGHRLALENRYLHKQNIALRKIIDIKNTVLEEISKSIDSFLYNCKNNLESFKIVDKSLENLQKEKKLRKSLSYQISEQIDENISDSLHVLQVQFQKIYSNHSGLVEKIQKDIQNSSELKQFYQENCSGIQVYQIPVELNFQKDQIDIGVQVDLFETPRNSDDDHQQQEEYITEGEPQLLIREIPEYITEVYQIPVELYVLDNQIAINEQEKIRQSKVQIKYESVDKNPIDLIVSQERNSIADQYDQINQLKKQNAKLRDLVQNSPFQFQIEIMSPYITIPIDSKDNQIQFPLEFIIQNDKNYDISIKNEEEVAPQVRSFENLPNNDNQLLSPNKEVDQIATRQKLSSFGQSVEIIQSDIPFKVQQSNNYSILEEIKIQEIPVECHIVEQKWKIVQVPIFKQVYIEKLVQVIKQVEVIHQIPIELLVQKIVYVDRIVQIPQQPIIYQVPVEVIVQKEVLRTSIVKMPVIKQIPVVVQQRVERRSIVKMPLLKQSQLSEHNEESQIQEVPVQLFLRGTSKSGVSYGSHYKNVDTISEEVPKQLKNQEVKIDFQLQLEIDENQLFRERIVYVDRIVEVEKIVEKIVQVQKIIERIVQVQRLVQVQKIVEVNSQVVQTVQMEQQIGSSNKLMRENQNIQWRICQIPIQLQIQVEKIIEYETIIEKTNQITIKQTNQIIVEKNRIFQIPIEVELYSANSQQNQGSKLKEREQPHQAQIEDHQISIKQDRVYQLAALNYTQSFQENKEQIQQDQIQIVFTKNSVNGQFTIEIPSEYILNTQNYQQNLVGRIQQKIVEVPIQVIIEVQKIVQKIVQVQKIVYVDRVIEVDRPQIVQKIIELIKIVQVPVELQVEPKIINNFVPYIVQIPVELEIPSNNIVQVPIEVNVDPIIYEIPIDIQNPIEVLQIPVQMQEPTIVIQIPVEMHMKYDHDVTQYPGLKMLPHQSKPQISQEDTLKNMIYVSESQNSILAQKLKKGVPHNTDNQLFVVQIPIELNMLKDIAYIEVQTDPWISDKSIEFGNHPYQESNRSDKDLFQTLKLLQSQPYENTKKVNIVQVPVEVMIDSWEDERKILQLKNRQRIVQLNEKYSVQIRSLHEVILNLQQIIVENNQEKDQIRFQLQNRALSSESLIRRINDKQEIIKNKEQEIQVIIKNHKQNMKALQEFKQKYADFLSYIEQLQNHTPIVYEMPVQLILNVVKQDIQIQTDENILASSISLIQIPIELEVVQKMNQSSIKINEDFSADERQNNQENIMKYNAFSLKPELVEKDVQTDDMRELIDSISFDIQTEGVRGTNQNIDLINMVDYTTFVKQKKGGLLFESGRREHFGDSNQVKLISGIESEDYQALVADIQIYQYPIQMIPEPIIYEVAVPVNVVKDVNEIQVQTAIYEQQFHFLTKQLEIIELPIEMDVKRDTSSTCIQTDNQFYRTEDGYFVLDYANNTNKLSQKSEGIRYQQEVNIENRLSQGYEARSYSRIIEVPIELNIQVKNDMISIDIQTSDNYYHPIKENITETNRKQKLFGICLAFDPIIIAPSNEENVFERQFKVDSRIQGKDHEQASGHSKLQRNIQGDQLELHFNEIEVIEKYEKGVDGKPTYSQLYQNAVGQVQKYHAMFIQKDRQNMQLKYELDSSISKYQQEIKHKQNHIISLQKIRQSTEKQLQQFKILNREKAEEFKQQEHKIQSLAEQYVRLKQQSQTAVQLLHKEIDRLKTIITDKISEIKELKIEQYQMKQMYQIQINQTRQKYRQKIEVINELEEQIQKKSNKIDQLIDYQEQMRRNIAYLREDQEHTAAIIYEQQFERIKDDFEDVKKDMKEELSNNQQLIEDLKRQLLEQTKNNRDILEENLYLEQLNAKLRQQNANLRAIKSEIQQNYVSGVKELNAELQDIRQMVREKDQIIQNIQLNPEKLCSGANNQIEDYCRPQTRMQYISRRVSRSFDDPKFTYSYIKKLEGVLLRYQKQLVNNQNTIQELQEKICEYLKDALDKQHQAETLYSKLMECKSAMDNILVEKITLEIENKRLSKSIDVSQRRILILGNKLLQATDNRREHKFEFDDDRYV